MSSTPLTRRASAAWQVLLQVHWTGTLAWPQEIWFRCKNTAKLLRPLCRAPPPAQICPLRQSFVTRSMASLRQEQAPRMDYGSGSREGPVARSTPTPDMASVPPLPRLALRRRPRRPILDPSATRCDAGVPPPRGSSDAAQPSSTLFHSPLISPPHINPLSLTTSHPFASLAGSRRHRGRPVLRPLYSRMWAVLGAMWTQREPHAQNCTLHLLGVSVLGRVAACMLVFRPAVEPCPCRAMSVRVRGACPCTAVVNLRVCM